MTSGMLCPTLLLSRFAAQRGKLLNQVADSKNREEFIKDLKGKYNGIVAIYRTFGSVEVALTAWERVNSR